MKSTFQMAQVPGFDSRLRQGVFLVACGEMREGKLFRKFARVTQLVQCQLAWSLQ